MKHAVAPFQAPSSALPPPTSGSQVVDNDHIAAVFDEIADLLDIEDANPFRIRAYRNAARTLRALTFDVAKNLARGEPLPKLTGIGVDLAGKINEIVTTGDCSLRQRLRSTLPPGLVGLLSIAGLGPRRVKNLYHDLGIETAQQLPEACDACATPSATSIFWWRQRPRWMSPRSSSAIRTFCLAPIKNPLSVSRQGAGLPGTQLPLICTTLSAFRASGFFGSEMLSTPLL
ncbi:MULTISPECIES: hypothetical protein [Pseudomonas]|jgi:hypothetical protein|uniref:Uncharacterized protein n=1 Tax=Pseudomonas umsongensis TaxID=198618 RepID=A0ACC5MEA1_9PSED|nr:MULTISPECIES: hypothetical protein [Pseudomonas]MBB2887057.1 hypothetical protein [Pseudomonas umsongensis]NMN78502.1 DNA polymerase IV (family X) [Pseudomonas sp. KD5]